VLVREPEGVPELVRDRAAVEKAEVHRGLVRRDSAAVGTNVGPSAVAGIERDANLRIGRVVEIEVEVRDVRPPTCLLARDGLLSWGPSHEPHAKSRAVHPRLADRRYGTRGAAAATRGGLEAHQLARKDAVIANLGSLGHVTLLVSRVKPAGCCE